ncbi:hypothetical protein ACLQ24_00300 [Micromonospora sp. DT4]|uniref:hypothetical protein n=1 Tax=Micromonospora sp. DT4 TaxID=3393438 RepID=UPI003CF6BFE3
MTNPIHPRHGQLAVTRISVRDARAFVATHATSGVSDGGRYGVAITAQTHPGQIPTIVAAAIVGRDPGMPGPAAQIVVAFDAPTTRMRRMLLAAVWDTARRMGYRALAVTGDHRHPGADGVEVIPQIAAGLPRHRRARVSRTARTGRQLTRNLREQPYYTGGQGPWLAP